MSIKRWFRWRGSTAKPTTRESFTMDATWDRTEELRPDRLGPDEYDVGVVPRDPERPSRTLGNI